LYLILLYNLSIGSYLYIFYCNNFTSFLKNLSIYFSSFPHGTSLLLGSRCYLALDEAYHLLRGAFPNNPTLKIRRHRKAQPTRSLYRIITFFDTPFQRICICCWPVDDDLWSYMSHEDELPRDYHFELVLLHSPLLKES